MAPSSTFNVMRRDDIVVLTAVRTQLSQRIDSVPSSDPVDSHLFVAHLHALQPHINLPGGPMPLPVLTVLVERFLRLPVETYRMGGSDFQAIVDKFLTVPLPTLFGEAVTRSQIFNDADPTSDTRWTDFLQQRKRRNELSDPDEEDQPLATIQNAPIPQVDGSEFFVDQLERPVIEPADLFIDVAAETLLSPDVPRAEAEPLATLSPPTKSPVDAPNVAALVLADTEIRVSIEPSIPSATAAFSSTLALIIEASPDVGSRDDVARYLYLQPRELMQMLTAPDDVSPERKRRLLRRLEVDFKGDQKMAGYEAHRDAFRAIIASEPVPVGVAVAGGPAFADLMRGMLSESGVSRDDGTLLLRFSLQNGVPLDRRANQISQETRRRIMAELIADQQGPKLFSAFERYRTALEATIVPLKRNVPGLLRQVIYESDITIRETAQLLDFPEVALRNFISEESLGVRTFKVQTLLDRLDADASGVGRFKAYLVYRDEIERLRRPPTIASDVPFQSLMRRMMNESEEAFMDAAVFFGMGEAAFRNALNPNKPLSLEKAEAMLKRLRADARSEGRFYAFPRYQGALVKKKASLKSDADLRLSPEYRSFVWDADPDNKIDRATAQTFYELLLLLLRDSGVHRGRGFELLHLSRPRISNLRDPDAVSQDTRARVLGRLYLDRMTNKKFSAFGAYEHRLLALLEPTKGDPRRVVRRIMLESLFEQQEAAAAALGVNAREWHDYLAGATRHARSFKLRHIIDRLEDDAAQRRPRFGAYPRFRQVLADASAPRALESDASPNAVLRAIITQSEETLRRAAPLMSISEGLLRRLMRGAAITPVIAQRIENALEADRGPDARFYAYPYHRDAFRAFVADIIAGRNVRPLAKAAEIAPEQPLDASAMSEESLVSAVPVVSPSLKNAEQNDPLAPPLPPPPKGAEAAFLGALASVVRVTSGARAAATSSKEPEAPAKTALQSGFRISAPNITLRPRPATDKATLTPSDAPLAVDRVVSGAKREVTASGHGAASGSPKIVKPGQKVVTRAASAAHPDLSAAARAFAEFRTRKASLQGGNKRTDEPDEVETEEVRPIDTILDVKGPSRDW